MTRTYGLLNSVNRARGSKLKPGNIVQSRFAFLEAADLQHVRLNDTGPFLEGGQPLS